MGKNEVIYFARYAIFQEVFDEPTVREIKNRIHEIVNEVDIL